MGKQEFLEIIYKKLVDCPKTWRLGQSIFNIIDMEFGVARDVQFLDGVDCFYVDSEIQKFLDLAWERYKIKQNDDENRKA